MSTEILKGTAAGVRESIHVTGDKSGVSTTHRTIFKLGATTVIFVSAGPPIIGEGDRLAVAGRRKGRQVLVAEAYVNQTAGIIGNAGLWNYFVGMLAGLTAGSAFLLAALLGIIPVVGHMDDVWRLFWGVFGLVCCVAGLYATYRWVRIRDAVKALKGG